MPAAAVIPAPVANIKVAAVKKLVVGCLVWCTWSLPALRVRCVRTGRASTICILCVFRKERATGYPLL